LYGIGKTGMIRVVVGKATEKRQLDFQEVISWITLW